MKVKVDYNKTVSFDIDAQNGFTPVCPDELPVEGGNLIVEELNKNATRAKYRFASKDAHPENGLWTATETEPQFSPVGLPNVDIKWNKHCVVGTHGFELLKGLPKMEEYDFFVYKGVEKDLHPYSPCYHDLEKKISTGIIEMAKMKDITTFILGGLALNYEENPLCLGTAALDLKDAKFEVIINLKSTAGIGSERGKKTFIDTLKSKGIIIVNCANDIIIG